MVKQHSNPKTSKGKVKSTVKNKPKPTFEKPAVIKRKYKGKSTKYAKWYDKQGKMHLRKISSTDKRIEREVFPPKKLAQGKPTMIRQVPPNVMKGIKENSKSDFEYSYALDFERHLKFPERMVTMKGSQTETTKIPDFELFGHNHPGHEIPKPSTGDVKSMKPLEPEFIVAGKSGKTIFLQVENERKFQKWKEKARAEGHSNPITNEMVRDLLRKPKYQRWFKKSFDDSVSMKHSYANILFENRKKEMDEKRAYKQAKKDYVNQVTQKKVLEYEESIRDLKYKSDQDKFTEITGVSITPYQKNTWVELKTDTNPEKVVRLNIPKEHLEAFHQGKEVLTKSSTTSHTKNIRTKMKQNFYYSDGINTYKVPENLNLKEIKKQYGNKSGKKIV